MPRAAQEGVRQLFEVFDADAGVDGQDALHQCPHVGVVTRVVLGHERAEPTEVVFKEGLPWLAFAQLRLRRRHFREAAKNEVQLDRHRLLAPQGAVVVEDRDPLLHRDGGRPAFAARTPDEVDDRLPGGAVPPRRQRLCRHILLLPARPAPRIERSGLHPEARFGQGRAVYDSSTVRPMVPGNREPCSYSRTATGASRSPISTTTTIVFRTTWASPVENQVGRPALRNLRDLWGPLGLRDRPLCPYSRIRTEFTSASPRPPVMRGGLSVTPPKTPDQPRPVGRPLRSRVEPRRYFFLPPLLDLPSFLLFLVFFAMVSPPSVMASVGVHRPAASAKWFSGGRWESQDLCSEGNAW
jgi:hypothetical protein